MHLSPYIWLLLTFAMPALVHAKTSQCNELFRQKQYVLAADCFLKAADKIQGQKTSPLLRFQKGRFLRNAAISLGSAAKQSKQVMKAAYWRERAVTLLDKYLAQKLYEIPIRATQARTLRKRFFKAIRHGHLAVNTRAATKLCLRGYQTRFCVKQSSWEGPLPPGKWTLTVRFPNGASVLRAVALPPLGKKRLSFKQPIAKVRVQFDTNSPTARMYLQGDGLGSEQKKQGKQWKVSLLPGVYVMRVFYGKESAWVQRFALRRQKPLRFSWKPDKPGVLVMSNPPGAQVQLNGIEQGKTPLRLLLQNGQYSLRTKSPCYLRDKRTISFPKSPEKLRVAQKPGALIQSHLAYQGLASSQRTLGLTSLIVGGAIVLFGVTGQIIASSLHTSAEEQQLLYKKEPIPSIAAKYEDLAKSGNTWRTIGSVGLGVGALGVGLGILRLATLPKPPVVPTKCSFE